jgi:hypothetical protein
MLCDYNGAKSEMSQVSQCLDVDRKSTTKFDEMNDKYAICSIRGCKRTGNRLISSIRGDVDLKHECSGRVCEGHYRQALHGHQRNRKSKRIRKRSSDTSHSRSVINNNSDNDSTSDDIGIFVNPKKNSKMKIETTTSTTFDDDDYVICNICAFTGIGQHLRSFLFVNTHWAHNISSMMIQFRNLPPQQLLSNASLSAPLVYKNDTLYYELYKQDWEGLGVELNESSSDDMMMIDEQIEADFEVEKIITKRYHNEYLIKYKGYDHSENTWEPISNLQCDDILEEFKENYKETKRARKNKTEQIRKLIKKKRSAEEDYISFLHRFGEKIMSSCKTLGVSLCEDRFSVDTLNGNVLRALLLEHSHRLKKYHEKFAEDIQNFDGNITLETTVFPRTKSTSEILMQKMTDKPEFSHLLEKEVIRELRYQFTQLQSDHKQESMMDIDYDDEMQRLQKFLSEGQ